MKKFIVVMLLAFGFTVSKAQVFLSVGAGKRIFSIQDTVCYTPTNSATDFYYIYVKNTGSTPFNGTVYMKIAVDSTMSGNGYQLTLPVDSFSNTTLNPGDSTVLSHTQLYDTNSVAPGPNASYKMGGNIVVIWPSAYGAITVDSSEHDTVYVLNCAGVNEIQDYNGLSIFPNPCTDKISLQLKGKISVSAIRVYNIQGEMLKEYRATNEISFTEFSAGMYFLKVEFADKTTHTYKIIRRE